MKSPPVKSQGCGLMPAASSPEADRSGRRDLSDEHLPPVDRLGVEHAMLAPGIVVHEFRQVAYVVGLDDDQRAVCPVGADGFGWVDGLPVVIDFAQWSAEQHS